MPAGRPCYPGCEYCVRWCPDKFTRGTTLWGGSSKYSTPRDQAAYAWPMLACGGTLAQAPHCRTDRQVGIVGVTLASSHKLTGFMLKPWAMGGLRVSWAGAWTGLAVKGTPSAPLGGRCIPHWMASNSHLPCTNSTPLSVVGGGHHRGLFTWHWEGRAGRQAGRQAGRHMLYMSSSHPLPCPCHTILGPAQHHGGAGRGAAARSAGWMLVQ
jgi:hypothetical protein